MRTIRPSILVRHGGSLSLSVVALLTSCLTQSLEGAAPTVERFSPAGVQRGATTAVAVVGGKLGTDPKFWCSQPGLKFEVTDGKLTVTAAADARPGRRWIRVYNSEGASSLRPFFVGVLPELNEVEPNNRISESTPLKAPRVVVNGVVSKSGDVDSWKLNLKENDVLVAALSAHRELGSPMDGILQVVSPAGFVVAQNDDARGFDPLLVYPVKVAGEYVIRVFAFPANPNSSIQLAGQASYVYRLTLTTGPYVNHTLPLAVRGPGESVRLEGWNLAADSHAVAEPLAHDLAAVVHDATVANAVQVDFTKIATVSEATDFGEERSVSLPVDVTGAIERPGDTDVFAFDGKKDQQVNLQVQSQSRGYPLDAVLEILGADGKVLSRVDDPKRNEFDAQMRYKIPADGRYKIRVSDLFGHGGPDYAYRLIAKLVQPDFGATIAEDRFAVTVGTPLKIPVDIQRLDGFAEPLVIRALDLPSGVTAADVRSDMKADSEKKVELVINATSVDSVGQSFRIAVMSVDGPERQKLAVRTLANPTAKTVDPWLTVKPKSK